MKNAMNFELVAGKEVVFVSAFPPTQAQVDAAAKASGYDRLDLKRGHEFQRFVHATGGK